MTTSNATKDALIEAFVADAAAVSALYWKYVNKTETCWLWTGMKMNGYGTVRRRMITVRRNLGATRIAWRLAGNALDPTLKICHKCDNPSCVNPAHLFLGTQSDNMKDSVAKGRTVRPSFAGHSQTQEAKDRIGRASKARRAKPPWTQSGRGGNKLTTYTPGALREFPRCTLCGAPRIPRGEQGAGTCTLIGCPDPLHDNRTEKGLKRVGLFASYMYQGGTWDTFVHLGNWTELIAEFNTEREARERGELWQAKLEGFLRESGAASPGLLEALKALYEETADYIRINHLGDVHHNRSMQMAREAIATAERGE